MMTMEYGRKLKYFMFKFGRAKRSVCAQSLYEWAIAIVARHGPVVELVDTADLKSVA